MEKRATKLGKLGCIVFNDDKEKSAAILTIPNFILIMLLIAQSLLMVRCAQWMSPTPDEYPHLASGLDHLRRGRCYLYLVNPPLMKVLAALPSSALPISVPSDIDLLPHRSRHEFLVGKEMFLINRELARVALFRARMVMILIAGLGTIGVYILARMILAKAFESNASSESVSIQWLALISAACYGLSPIVLGYGCILQTDISASTIGLFAMIALLLWSRQPSIGLAILAGLWLGLACLSKYTWLLGFGFVPLFAKLARNGSFCWKPLIVQTIVIWAAAIITINAGFRFDGTGTPLAELNFHSDKLTYQNFAGDRANRFAATWFGRIPVPFPEPMMMGLDVQRIDFEQPLRAIILGNVHPQGVWWFYLVGLPAKIPMVTLLLIIAGMFVSMRTQLALLVCVLVPIAFIAVVSSQTAMNTHVRYSFQAFPFLCVAASLGAGFIFRRARNRQITRIILLVAYFASLFETVAWHPNYIPFLNVAVGGERSVGWLLGGSGADWNQGWCLLREDLHKLDQSDRRLVTIRSRWVGAEYAGYATADFDLNDLSSRGVRIILPLREIETRPEELDAFKQRSRCVGRFESVFEIFDCDASDLRDLPFELVELQ